jgi:hypothetical protein
MEPADIRLRQLSRMLGEPLDASSVPERLEQDPIPFADAVFEEAASSDDVTGAAEAMAYLDNRLDFFSDYLSPALRSIIRSHFVARWNTWEQL